MNNLIDRWVPNYRSRGYSYGQASQIANKAEQMQKSDSRYRDWTYYLDCAIKELEM